MKVIDINELERYKDFLILRGKRADVVFSTAKDKRSFNRNTDEGMNNINSLKNDFNINNIAFLNQIHSDKVFEYTKDKDDFNDNEGDGIVTNEQDVIIGAFTADCVPIILVDEEEGVISAIHSGWKGTFNSIAKKAVEIMKDEYSCNANNIKAYVGPHIRQCCYEVSEELKSKFVEKADIDESELFKGRNLSMERFIEEDLKESGIEDDNIYSINLCTYCDENIDLFSYRKSEGAYGRLFTFVYKK